MTARGSGRVQVALDGEQVGTLSFHSESWAAEGIAGLSQTAVFSFGSDGTDGPTDAAGGYVDGESLAELEESGIANIRIKKAPQSWRYVGGENNYWHKHIHRTSQTRNRT